MLHLCAELLPPVLSVRTALLLFYSAVRPTAATAATAGYPATATATVSATAAADGIGVADGVSAASSDSEGDASLEALTEQCRVVGGRVLLLAAAQHLLSHFTEAVRCPLFALLHSASESHPAPAPAPECTWRAAPECTWRADEAWRYAWDLLVLARREAEECAQEQQPVDGHMRARAGHPGMGEGETIARTQAQSHGSGRATVHPHAGTQAGLEHEPNADPEVSLYSPLDTERGVVAGPGAQSCLLLRLLATLKPPAQQASAA